MWTRAVRSLGVGLAVCLLTTPLWAAEGETAGDSGESAVWTHKELKFVYMGFTTRYSCDGLRDKIKGVLLDLGARKKDLKVYETGCSAPTGRPEPFPGVSIKMQVLQRASSNPDSKEAPVQARWKPVDLRLRDTLVNESGECELIEQIRNTILPLFATRNVEMQTNCIPHQATATRPTLKLEVLALAAPEGKGQNAKGATPGW